MAAVKSWFRSATELAVCGLLWLAAALTGLATTADPVAAAAPESDSEALAARLAGLDHYAATFRQVMADDRGRVLEESTGYVLLKRPDFKWVVDDPYPQLIVTHGDTLRIYDPDLAQLTIKPLTEALADTPISLLTRNDVMLRDDLRVTRLTAESASVGETGEITNPGWETFAVVPKSQDSLFAEIRLAFSPEGLASLGILDHLGQYTEIRFEVEDRVIQSADFEIDVPPGTDVIDG